MDEDIKIIAAPIKSQSQNNVVKKKYVPLVKTEDKPKIIPSKVMIIENLRVIIKDDLDQDFQFVVDTTFGPVHNGIIPKVDISAKEDIEFDYDTKLENIKAIIRRCGILEQYKDYFTNDPDIVINSYTLDIHKEYQFFDEFKDGLLTIEQIF